jgi:hypothetical protein
MARPGLEPGHHDSQQLLAPDDRAGPRPSGRCHSHGGHSAELALARHSPGHECRNHAGTSDQRRRAVALPPKRARAHGASRRSPLVQRERLAGRWADARSWRIASAPRGARVRAVVGGDRAHSAAVGATREGLAPGCPVRALRVIAIWRSRARRPSRRPTPFGPRLIQRPLELCELTSTTQELAERL